jgi:hypothetical protein
MAVPRIAGAPHTSLARSTAHVNPQRAGTVTGLVCAGWHFLWVALVASGAAQPLIDFVFWVHFIKPVYVVEPFEPLRALVLVVVTGAAAYGVGGIFALVWNRMHR